MLLGSLDEELQPDSYSSERKAASESKEFYRFRYLPYVRKDNKAVYIHSWAY